jgi:hypothetical protein
MRRVDLGTTLSVLLALFALACGGPTAPGPPPALTVVSGTGQTVTVGSHVPQPIVFQAEDRNGATLPAQFTFTLRSITCTTSNGTQCFAVPGDDQLVNPTLTTGPDGKATFTGWTLGTKISESKCLGAYPGTSQPKDNSDLGLTVVCVFPLPGPPAQLTKPSTDNQQAPAGSTLTGMAVGVLDQYGNSLGCIQVSALFCVGGRDVQITFTPSAGGQVSQTQVTTNRGGAAVDWTIASGANTLTIAVGSLSVTYSATGL